MTAAGSVRTGPLPRHVRLWLRLSRRDLPPPLCAVTVERHIEVPAGDGVSLLTDHYRPLTDDAAPTLLVRCPYGRGFPWDSLYGALLAGQGFHVVVQSCRGTGGSGGHFHPFRHEAADGHAALAWLRRQDWFNGALGTIGASYLGYTQWALADDAPPELQAMVAQVSLTDPYGFFYPGGAFTLQSTLTGTAAMLSMDRGAARFLVAMARLARTYRRIGRTLPLIDAYPAAFGRRAAFFEEWLAHPDAGDPYWDGLRAGSGPAEPAVPVSLLTGWSDVCLDGNLERYRQLRDAGREVRLTVGPWNHTSGFSRDLPVVLAEALGWLRDHLDGDRSGPPAQPVRVHIGELGGPGEWRDLADWPPPHTAPQTLHVHGNGTLAATPPARESTSRIHYDPAKPTPSVGGPALDSRTTGPVRNDALESRPDVLVFTGPPLSTPLEVIGPVSVRLQVRGSGRHFDVFARLCEVDERGHSWNICDGLLRLGGDTDSRDADSHRWKTVTVAMSATAHRFRAGHRLRLQISGGAHPRFARNTGSGEPPATATHLVPVDIEILHGTGQPCLLTLPVTDGPGDQRAGRT